MTLLNPWVWLAMIVALALSFGAGVKVESNQRDAQLLTQERAHHEAVAALTAHYRGISQDISKDLNNERTARQGDAQQFRVELQRSVARGTQLATCGPVWAPPATMVAGEQLAAPRPASLRGDPRFTREFVRLFDLALVPSRVPVAGDPGSADASTAGAGDVGAELVLTVHAENADAWAECRSTLKGWQTLARTHGWAK